MSTSNNGHPVAAAAPQQDLQIVRAEDADYPEVEAFVASAPRAHFWHRPAWMAAVREIYPFPDFTLIARRNGAVAGVLPLALCETLTLERNLVSVPYGVYGGAAGADESVEHALVDAARQLAVKERVGCLELRQRDGVAPGLQESDLYVTFIRDLPATVEEVSLILPRKARAAARQGRDKFKLTFDEGMWYLDDFYRLFSRNKRHLGSPPLPREFFERLVETFHGNVFLHIVRHEVRPIAAVLSFTFGDTLLPYYSGGLAEFEALQCNNFLYWKLMEWGVERGYRRFDFGRSRRDSGPYHFKKNQGFEPRPLHYSYYLVKRREIPRFNPSNPAFDMPRRVWQSLPVSMHEWLGARLSRYLP